MPYKHPGRKLTDRQAELIVRIYHGKLEPRRRCKSPMSQVELAALLNVKRRVIYQIVQGAAYKEVYDKVMGYPAPMKANGE
jgi:ribosome-binding protein aMBF1 (putative translation factor)